MVEADQLGNVFTGGCWSATNSGVKNRGLVVKVGSADEDAPTTENHSSCEYEHISIRVGGKPH